MGQFREVQPVAFAASTPPPGWEDPFAGHQPPPVSGPGAPPPPAGNGGRTRRPLVWLGLATVVALAAILVLSLRGGGSGGNPFSPIADAAERTARSPGAKLAGTGTVTVAGQQMTMQFSGEYDGRDNQSSLRMEVQTPGAPQVATMMNPFVSVSDGPVTYMTSPAFAGQMPDGKTWMSVDATELGATDANASATDAASLLAELQSVGGDTTVVGHESLRGARTVHYQASLSQPTGTSTVGVWVDGKGYVRRMTLAAPFGIPGQPSAVMSMQLDLYDFGIKPQIQVPSADETFDATEIARQAADAASGQS